MKNLQSYFDNFEPIYFVAIILVIIFVILYVYNRVSNSKKSCDCHEIDVNSPPNRVEHIDNNKFSLNLYYASWCGHSKNFMPDWEKVKTQLSDVIECREHECDNNVEFCRLGGAKGYPSIVLNKPDGSIISFPNDKPRTPEEIIKFVKESI